MAGIRPLSFRRVALRKRMIRAASGFIKWSLFAAFAITVATLLGFHFRDDIANEVGRYLVRPSNREKSDIIFVLGGEPAVRLSLGVSLLKDGLADELWYSATAESENDRAFKAQFGFSPGEEFIVASALEKSALRKDQWRILPGSISTWSDFTHLKEALESRGGGPVSVLVVSYPYHFRRVDFCIRRIFGDSVAPDDVTFRYAFPSREEWAAGLNDPDDVPLLIATEYAKLLAYKLKYFPTSL